MQKKLGTKVELPENVETKTWFSPSFFHDMGSQKLRVGVKFDRQTQTVRVSY